MVMIVKVFTHFLSALLLQSLVHAEDNTFEEVKLSNVLKQAGWMEYHENLGFKPVIKQDETVSYLGNVPPTNLYKCESHYILPTAPYVHPYNPVFDYDYVYGAFQLRPTEKIKEFFNVPEVSQCYFVAQRIVETKEGQLLRLHGFAHGVNAGNLNVNKNVQVQIKPIKGSFEILFSDQSQVKNESVFVHGGVASPNNFLLKGFKSEVYQQGPFWQAISIYLPETKACALIVLGHQIFDMDLSLFLQEPVLVNEAVSFLESLIDS